MRTSNPILQGKFFETTTRTSSDVMTVRGTVNKTLIMLGLVVVAAAYTWGKFATMGASAITPFLIGGAIGGLVLGLVTIFKQDWARITAPAYAICQGLFIGGLSATLDAQYPGVVIQAVGLTFGTMFCLLGAYLSGLISVTEKFRAGLLSAMGGLIVFYIATFVMGLFGVDTSFMSGGGIFSIGLSMVVVVIAALNLVLDFDFIDTAAQNRAPKNMEWIGAFGLMVTLIWLYIEILRLLTKLSQRRD
jgi:uncharacterized YccA/Bax inhibitor family protein